MQCRENKVPGKRSLNGDLRRLEIARFADHNPVGILPEKSAQGPSKGQADCLVDRHLHDSFEIVFDRLFRGE